MILKQLGRFFFVFFISFNVWAQNEGGDEMGTNVRYEVGGHLGKILPNQIPGMTEVTGLGGVRMGYRLSPMVFVEGGGIFGNGNNTEYKNFSLSLRMDMPLESLVGIIYLGPDITYYRGSDRSNKLFGGGHAGGGIMTQLGGSVWFRGDMKFTINPGTSLYVGFGFMFRMGGGGS